MTFHVVDELGPVRESWDELAAAMAAPPWLCPGWFEAWGAAFGPAAWSVHVLREAGDTVGVAPFLVRRPRMLQTPTNWHTPEYALLVRPEWRQTLVGGEPYKYRFANADPGLETMATARTPGRPRPRRCDRRRTFTSLGRRLMA